MLLDPRIALVGLIVGTFVGFSGVGGGSLLLPLLVLTMRVEPSLAIGTDLLASVPTKLLALSLHARRGNVDWPLTRGLVAGGVPGALAGLAAFAVLRTWLGERELQLVLRHAIGIAILAACVGAIATWIVRARTSARHATSHATSATEGSARAQAIAIGAIVGFLASITSVGGGSIALPLLAFAMPALALRRLVGCEIALSAALLPIAALGHVSFGDIDGRLAMGLLVGSLPGVWLGSRMSTAIGEAWLRPVLVGTLAFAGSQLV